MSEMLMGSKKMKKKNMCGKQRQKKDNKGRATSHQQSKHHADEVF